MSEAISTRPAVRAYMDLTEEDDAFETGPSNFRRLVISLMTVGAIATPFVWVGAAAADDSQQASAVISKSEGSDDEGDDDNSGPGGGDDDSGRGRGRGRGRGGDD